MNVCQEVNCQVTCTNVANAYAALDAVVKVGEIAFACAFFYSFFFP